MKMLFSTKESIVKKILLTGIAGTTTMTIYSYLISRKKGKHFREPQLLNYLLYGKDRVKMGPVEKSRQPPTGFLAHYCTGILFSSCYHLLWKKKIKTNVIKSGIGFGLIFGILGITIWKTVFKIHSSPPKIDINKYLRHLIIAHLIFGTTVALCSEADNKVKK